ncbi:glycosyltransferase [Nakamurella sp. GG22]
MSVVDKREPISARAKVEATGPSGSVGVITVTAGHSPLHGTDGAVEAVTAAAAARVARMLPAGETALQEGPDRIVVRMRDSGRRRQLRRMELMTKEIVRSPLAVADRRFHVEVGTGWAEHGRRTDAAVLATRRADESLSSRDLMVRDDLITDRRSSGRRSKTGAQVSLSLVLSLLVPFLIMVAGYRQGWDISAVVYWVLVAGFGTMVVMQWAEALHALNPPSLPEPSGRPAPRATAIIAAYLPNEADTIIETLRAFLGQRYSGGLQIILAYNTPHELPVEQELRRLAEDHPDLLLLPVTDSTSKAQNVNAAISRVEGEFVGIFDADHHPMTGAFERAWRWIGSGVDIVQGHCVIRNGSDSRVAQLVAVEFEQIYAVSHPGRQSVHGFGVFGGSNGFWRTQVLRETRLRTRFLTEDIESSIRAVREGRQIVNDPGLVSRELAPETAGALWKQRMRWAQGWFQVSFTHVRGAFVDPALPPRQRFGMAFLLGWREIYPWLSSLMWPVLAFTLWRDGSLPLNSPALLIITLFTLTCGPIQVLFAYRLGVPEIRQHRRWWWVYALCSAMFYQEAKNLIGRVAQIKQLMGERHWAVTPRRAPAQAVHGLVGETA